METKATIVRTFSNELQILVARAELVTDEDAHYTVFVNDAEAIVTWLRSAIPRATLELLYKRLCDNPPVE